MTFFSWLTKFILRPLGLEQWQRVCIFTFRNWKPEAIEDGRRDHYVNSFGCYADELAAGHEHPEYPLGLLFIDTSPEGENSGTQPGATITVTYDPRNISETGIREYLEKTGIDVE